MIEVIGTDEFAEWYEGLDDAATVSVTAVVDLLAQAGVALGFPYSSEIKAAGFALRELRIQSAGRPLRVFYAFDPKRQAVLLLGGDKTGNDRFYEQFIPRATAIWEEYLRNQG